MRQQSVSQIAVRSNIPASGYGIYRTIALHRSLVELSGLCRERTIMDPNANLAEQRELIANIIDAWDDADDDGNIPNPDDVIHDAIRLAELAEALDGWIAGGGFLPTAWGVRA
jgi:hypothetical protein